MLRRLGPASASKRSVPAGGDVADRLLELGLGDARRLAARATDDEVDAGDAAFRKGRIIGGNTAVIDGLQIGADLLAHDRNRIPRAAR